MLGLGLDLANVCLDCLSLNSSGFGMLYAAIVLYVGLVYSRQSPQPQQASVGMPDLSQFAIPVASFQTMVLQITAAFLTPNTYVATLMFCARKMDQLTGVSRRSFIGNVIVFFLFYYFIVSAPAAVMLPTNYPGAKYDLQSIAALFLMMLTNATGDVISYKITMANVKRVTEFQAKAIGRRNHTSFVDCIKTELSLYAITLIDMAFAFAICLVVLLLTSVYFGVSVGEYKFEFSQQALSGATKRLLMFWDTALEPYWIKKDWADSSGNGLPMLLIYSVSSFIPTILFAAFAALWTFLMPIRIIFFANIKKPIKILASEFSVLALCVGAMSAWHLL